MLNLLFLVLIFNSSSALDKDLKPGDFIKNQIDNKIDTSDARKKIASIKGKPDYFYKIWGNYYKCWDEVKEKSIKYLFSFQTRMDIEFKVNEIKIRGRKFEFNITNDCKKLYPISFRSANNQNWLGIDLEKDEKVEALFGKPNQTEEIYIYGGSYYPTSAIDYKFKITTEFHKINMLKSHNKQTPFDRSHDNYYRFTKKNGDIKYFFVDNFYKENEIFNAGELTYKDGKPQIIVPVDFDFGITPYFGNKICYLNRELKIVFQGKEKIFNPIYKGNNFFKSEIMKNKEGKTLYNAEGKVRFSGKFNPTKQDIVDGRKCNRKIAEYEKKTGRKVPYSTLFSKDQIQEILKNHWYE